MRDAFPPPMCCVDCLRVSFGWDCAWRSIVSVGGNHSFVAGDNVPFLMVLDGQNSRSEERRVGKECAI